MVIFNGVETVFFKGEAREGSCVYCVHEPTATNFIDLFHFVVHCSTEKKHILSFSVFQCAFSNCLQSGSISER